MYVASVKRGRKVKGVFYDVLTSKEEIGARLAKAVEALGSVTDPEVLGLMTFDRIGDFLSERFFTISEATEWLSSRPVLSRDYPSGTILTIVLK
jgi:hypothetical protein